ncbi:hypothetical protein B0H63DRAFT_164815 [Podospora didyma]|uniref:Uncharacterized protein n=1 Tax=Podospora didyma TaxID=330526 RepID=A0AAE0U1P4_9PEZI|nr:hypothetical protein B0H63DRAFT_164815 [Podospora didyma]
MVGPKHDYVKEQIVVHIRADWRSLRGQREPSTTGQSTGLASPVQTGPRQISALEFAALIKSRGSPRLQFRIDPKGPISEHEPDASFGLVSADYPGVVLEVSYSQNAKELVKLANKYLLDTPGPRIQVVITLAIVWNFLIFHLRPLRG